MITPRFRGSALLGLLAAGLSLTGAPAASAEAGDDAHVLAVAETVDPFEVSDAAVECAVGERAIGGGVQTNSGDRYSRLIADGPLDATGTTVNTDDGDVARFWYSQIVNGGGATETFTHYAICSATSDAYLEAESFAVPSASSHGGGASIPGDAGAVAHCQAGTRAIGGGYGAGTDRVEHRGIASQPAAAGGSSAGPDTGEAAVGWSVHIENFDEEEAPPMKVFAVCSPTSKATVQTTSFDTAGVDQRAAECPGLGLATGGGFGATTDAARGMWMSSAPATPGGDPAIASGEVPHGWFGRVDATGLGATYRVYALCEPGAQPSPAAPGSAAGGKRAAALRRCKKKHSRRARKQCRRRARRLPV